VPIDLVPPENEDELLKQAYMLCATCKKSLLEKSKRVYKCNTCENYLCKDCKGNHDEGHDVHRDRTREDAEETKEKSEFLDGALEEYYNLGFEDIIGKDIYTRFKYTKVRDHDFGLSNEEILLLNDKELNKLVSLKKYKPYRHDEERVNIHRIINMKRKYKERIDEEKSQLKNALKQTINIQKEKLLDIKTGAQQKLKEIKREAKYKDKVIEKKEIYAEKEQKSYSGKRNRKDLYKL
jgi:hypothetical protein